MGIGKDVTSYTKDYSSLSHKINENSKWKEIGKRRKKIKKNFKCRKELAN